MQTDTYDLADLPAQMRAARHAVRHGTYAEQDAAEAALAAHTAERFAAIDAARCPDCAGTRWDHSAHWQCPSDQGA
jgi:hypothetical protein